MGSRRPLLSGVAAAAALLPPLAWLGPGLLGRLAPSFRDQADFFYPVKLYTADRIRAGEIPLWNPLSGAGEPWLANLQSGVFYPPGLLFLLASPALAGLLYLLLHYAVGAWGMRRFAKQEGVSDAGALVAAAIFTGSGLAASLSAYWNHFGAWMYLPAIAALARSGLRRRASRLGLALLTALQLMAGSPEVSGLTVALALALALSAPADPEKPWLAEPRARSLARCAGGLLLGLALSGAVLVPFIELALRSDRRDTAASAGGESGAVPASAMLSAAGLSAAGSAGAYLPSVYLGPVALLAAAAAFREKERRGLALLLAAAAVAGLVLALEGPPGSWIRSLTPLDRVRYPAKALTLTFFSAAALAGLGADALRFRAASVRARVFFGAASAAAAAVALLGPHPLAARLASLVGVAALLLLALTAGRRPMVGGALEGAAALALLAGFALSLAPLSRFAPEREIRRRPEGVASLAQLAGRVLTPPMSDLSRWVLRGDERYSSETLRRQRAALLGYTNLLFGVPSVRTAAALATREAGRIAAAMDGAPDPVRAAGPASARVLWTPFRPARLPSRRLEDFYRAPLAPYRPRLSFLRSWRVEPDAARAWRRTASGEIDLAREVFLERAPAIPMPQDEGRPLLVAGLAEDRPERVVAEITTSRPGILLLTDVYYPGWTAAVDGKKTEVLRADGVFRAVALPAGSHRIVFQYRPVSFYAGAALSLAALLVIGVLFYAGEPVAIGRAR